MATCRGHRHILGGRRERRDITLPRPVATYSGDISIILQKDGMSVSRRRGYKTRANRGVRHVHQSQERVSRRHCPSVVAHEDRMTGSCGDRDVPCTLRERGNGALPAVIATASHGGAIAT